MALARVADKYLWAIGGRGMLLQSCIPVMATQERQAAAREKGRERKKRREQQRHQQEQKTQAPASKEPKPEPEPVGEPPAPQAAPTVFVPRERDIIMVDEEKQKYLPRKGNKKKAWLRWHDAPANNVLALLLTLSVLSEACGQLLFVVRRFEIPK